MTEYTPGPWEVRPDPSHYDSMSEVYPVGSDVMIAATGGEIKTMEANARLIAAAPYLLASLCETLAIAEQSETGPFADRARAAIAKAKGEK